VCSLRVTALATSRGDTAAASSAGKTLPATPIRGRLLTCIRNRDRLSDSTAYLLRCSGNRPGGVIPGDKNPLTP
jgi:hypothetical protein